MGGGDDHFKPFRFEILFAAYTESPSFGFLQFVLACRPNGPPTCDGGGARGGPLPPPPPAGCTTDPNVPEPGNRNVLSVVFRVSAVPEYIS